MSLPPSLTIKRSRLEPDGRYAGVIYLIQARNQEILQYYDSKTEYDFVVSGGACIIWRDLANLLQKRSSGFSYSGRQDDLISNDIRPTLSLFHAIKL